jgi:hypothetical protein
MPGSPSALQAELERLRTENGVLRTELASEQSRRQQREQEWLEYTRAVAELAPKAGVAPPSFATDAGTAQIPTAPQAIPPDPSVAARAERDAQILRRMQALLIADSVQGLDALELGTLQDGFTGPVVFRALDDEGRPVGSICADKLELEGSRAARTLTFVFSKGYQRRGELRTPFPGTGVLRIELPEVDPTPWIEALPELFTKAQPRQPMDDALHDLTKLRVALNLQLREDAAAGYWRLACLAARARTGPVLTGGKASPSGSSSGSSERERPAHCPIGAAPNETAGGAARKGRGTGEPAC